MLTKELVEKALPATLRSSVTDAFVAQINGVVSDPLIAEQVRNNFVSYAGILKDGKFKTEDYLHAVVFVSHKLMGMSNQDAYIATFPQRYQILLGKGVSSKDLSAYVAAYARGKLVNLILEQSLVPTWVLNQDLYQKALNKQAWLMENAASEKVQTEAANSLLTHLAKPKEAAAISIDMRETSGVRELKDLLTSLAQRQREAIQSGTATKEIAAARIIDVEPEPVDGTD